tara:strand:+ start:167 stop:847 length:681 start_codon:yes stop_codon:yes gene_type:complete
LKFTKTNKTGFNNNNEENKAEPSPEELLTMLLAPPEPSPASAPRIAAIYGDIDQDRCSDAIYSMLCLKEAGAYYIEDPKDPEGPPIKTYAPFDFYISTWGGSALDMFAVYDVMHKIKRDCDISTYGIGKVMSAGTILLAAGTKGKRKVGANCRLMIHGVTSGQQGSLHDLENEMNEAKWTQKQYVKVLSKESNMSQKQIKDLLNKKINIYFDAEQALKYGIADEII